MPSTEGHNKSWLAFTRDWLVSRSSTHTGRPFKTCIPARIGVFGLDAAGKSTLLRRHLSQDRGRDVRIFIPAIGWNIEDLSYGNGLRFESFDLGGCSKTRARERHRTRKCDAVIWVVDSCDDERWAVTYQELFAMTASGLDDDPNRHLRKPLLVLANKQG